MASCSSFSSLSSFFPFPFIFSSWRLFEVSLPRRSVGSVQSSLSSQGHLCFLAQPQWGLFVALRWSPTTASSSGEVCASACVHLCVQYFFSLSSIICSPPFAFSVAGPQSARLALKCSQSMATQERQKTGTQCFLHF